MTICQRVTKEDAIMSPKSLILFLEKWVAENSFAEDDYQLDGNVRKNNPTKWVHFRYRGQSKQHYGIFAINGDTKIGAVKKLIQLSKTDSALFDETFTPDVNNPRLDIKEGDSGFYCYKLVG